MYSKDYIFLSMQETGWIHVAVLMLTVSQLSVSKTAPQLSVSRKVHLDGFHRILETEFLVNNVLTEYGDCNWAMDQTIPSGAYVDPFQIKEYERSNAIPHETHIIGLVDIEAAQQHADAHRIIIYFNETTVKLWNKLYAKFPFHLRYHKAKHGGGSVIVRLSAPTLLIRCRELNITELEAPCCPLCQNCAWSIANPIEVPEDILLQVPVGNLDDEHIVIIVTVIMILGGCYYIISPISEVIKF